MKPTGSPPPRPKKPHESQQRQDQHRQCQGCSNMPTLSTQLPCANRSCWKSLDAMHQQSDNSNSYVQFSQHSYGLLLLAPGISSITPTIMETPSQYSSPVTPPPPPPLSSPPSAMGTLS
ncbi:unnamed protein product [Schistocephalus solidus]|uniref:Ovule protein n=1 Tax=Schistocephalus solidus TaxID=70667 RepID=A0A183T3C8_SCHSO|nr:unnamed protein product [Schistocephalus solidus]